MKQKDYKYIVTTGGGLGNQIMQYALWSHFKSEGISTSLVLRRNDIGRLFLSLDVPTVSVFDSVFVKVRDYLRFIYDGVNWIKERKRLNTFPIVFNRTIIDFPQWNDYTFIYKEKQNLTKILAFPEEVDNRNITIKKKIIETNSVSIHIRRGDYQNSTHWRMILGDICDKKYYEEAIQKTKEIIPSPVFFVFSDDIDWVKKNLSIENPVYVDWNIDNKAFRDIELMSYCKVNIIANSTFSLCASYLNKNEDSFTIAPLKWRNAFGDNLYEKYLDKEKTTFINNNKPQISIVTKTKLSSEDIMFIQRQSYTDFEVISATEIDDDRFRRGEPIGNNIFEYTIDSLKLFKDRHFLSKWLFSLYEGGKK